MLGNAPNAGGKDYLGLGEGNDAYQNYIETMTIDTGHNNPGAVGADYLASNVGAIRGVRIVAPDGKGKTGILLTRKWIGPALIKDVSIEGFDTGIDVANTEYSIALDGIRISKSSGYGIRNTSNSVSFSNVSISTVNGVGIANLTPQALLVGRGLRIEGKNEKTVLNQGYINLVEPGGALVTSGKGSRQDTTEEGNKLDGVYGPSGKIGDPAWQLPVNPRRPRQYPTKEWADISKFGAVADTHHDSTAAIQAAMNSGRPVICFPNGVYRTTAPIVIPYTVHRIEGSFATVYLDFHRPDPDSDSPARPCIRQGSWSGPGNAAIFAAPDNPERYQRHDEYRKDGVC